MQLRQQVKKWLTRTLGLRAEMPLSFYALDVLFRRLLRQNAGVRWAVHHTSTIRSPHRLVVGQGCFPGDSPGVYINADNGIHIGDFTNLGPQVGLISANHDAVNNVGHVAAAPLRIGRFCWLGMGAVVLPGVELGDFTIVGAGAVVTRSFPAGHCVVAGNPARLLKHLNQDECHAQAQRRYEQHAAGQ
ncbi:transferase hexapeptide (six repeat-containing protein) [Hymenobacter daecheongensis DSM 21074]|uniref:Transferase hexapeptide (Six repeat-containing protein) n=1 Tax=Hymenobacter daecheongensis DSM 21074 TaxID=1121955 RepID=A0A1M6LDS6_9BACT|nr:acyltransferase [Hymenobacter daecheongensis]SHJ69235.1 transferase hexapeptide (six repeat-containing protein) [Hymenobacter daecheongensis DSM 21074]